MSRNAEGIEGELARRHRRALWAIIWVLVLTLVLGALAFLGLIPRVGDYDPTIDIALRVAVVFAGLGAVALRRARFSPTRLQAVVGLRGASGLLATLEKTTVQVSLLAAAIALMGYALTVVWRGAEGPPAMAWIGLIAVAVLLYAYPRRAAWRRVLQLAERGDLAGEQAMKGTAA